MKKYHRFLSLLLLIPMLACLLPAPAAALDDPVVYCTNALLLDATHDEVLYDKAGSEKAYPASLTKVLTALLVMEAIESGQLSAGTFVTAGETAYQGWMDGASTANIKVGEVLTVEELLYCLLLPSANEAANILAVAVDGTIEDFVAHMNRRAGEMGCQGTHFANPHGLHNDDHYTTAYDLALIMEAALEYDLFRTIIATAVHTVPATNLSEERLFYNSNGLISNYWYSGYVYSKCIGGKTGTTEEAGRCLLSAAEDGDTLLISVILGSGPVEVPGRDDLAQGQLISSSNLLEWGFDNFEQVTLTQEDTPVAQVSVTMSRQTDSVMVKPQGSVTLTLPKDLDVEAVETNISLFSQEVEAPVQEGEVLGTMTLSYEGELLGSLDLVAVTSVERSDLLYKKSQFISFFQTWWVRLVLIAVILVAAFAAFQLLVLRKRRRYRAGAGSGHRRGSYRGCRR